MDNPTSDDQEDRRMQLAVKAAALRVELARLRFDRRRDVFRMVLSGALAVLLFFSGLQADSPIATWLSAVPFLFAAYLVTYVMKLSRRIEDLYQEIERLDPVEPKMRAFLESDRGRIQP